MLSLGKKPARYDARDLQYADYRDTLVLPTLPVMWGHGLLYPDWLMLGNDAVGDCVFAAADHEVMLWNRAWGAKVDVPFTDAATLSDYSAVTGYDPNDPNTDQGTDMRTALDYRRRTGTVDANGKRHKIYAYLALEPGNWQQMLEATYIFGAAEIGFEFPASAMDQFNAGKPWSVVPGSPIEGGHDVPCMGFGNPSAGYCAIVTWGRRQLMTRAFYEKYADEAYAILSAETINALGAGPHGFNLTQLKADLAAL